MQNMMLSKIVWKEGVHFVALCLNVDVSSFGSTKKEALSNLDEALELYFEDTEAPTPIQVLEPEIISQELFDD